MWIAEHSLTSVYSPVVLGHQMARYGRKIHSTSHTFWMLQSSPMLFASMGMVILPLPGWRQSVGMWQEIAQCRHHGIPIFTYDMPQWPHAGELEILTKQDLAQHGWASMSAF